MEKFMLVLNKINLCVWKGMKEVFMGEVSLKSFRVFIRLFLIWIYYRFKFVLSFEFLETGFDLCFRIVVCEILG